MRYLKVSVVIFALLFTSCSNYREIENNVVITACFAEKTDAYCNYIFYVSDMPKGEGGESDDSDSLGKEYKITAESFGSAVEQLKANGMQGIDLNHISFYGGNREYFNEVFVHDEKDIRKYISVMGLTYTAVIPAGYSAVAECINSEYNSSPSDFADNVLGTKVSGLSSTLAELSLCVNNIYYTAVIPELLISEAEDTKLPVISNVSVFSAKHGAVTLTSAESGVYISWRKQNGRYYNLYNINKTDNKLSVVLQDSDVRDIAVKYSLMNIDILNTKYYSAKQFLTYSDYEKYFKDYNLYDTDFVFGEI